MKKLGLIFSLLIAIFFSTQAQGYEVGDFVTDFNLKNIDGRMISMKDYPQAKGFIIVFTCNHCPFSKLYEDRIIELNTEFAAKGFPVIAINPNDSIKSPGDSYSEMVARAKDKKILFPYLLDASQEVAKTFGAARTPHVFVVERLKTDLKIAYIGAVDNNAEEAAKADKKYVKDAVDALLSGKKVIINNVRAIGCTIKWKDE